MFWERVCQEDRPRIFTVLHDRRTRDNRNWKREFQKIWGKTFLPWRQTRIGIGCSEVVQFPSLQFFKTRQAVSNLIWSHSWPYLEQEVGLETSRVIQAWIILWFGKSKSRMGPAPQRYTQEGCGVWGWISLYKSADGVQNETRCSRPV